MQILEDNHSDQVKDLAKRIAALRERVQELLENREESTVANDDLVQENILLKKQIENREKTIKNLNFKLEMFKLAKNLREGAGIDSKSEDLKKIIDKYIKEIDKSIASLNIK